MAETDRELLELAAKAAGMSGTCVDYDDRLVFLEDGKPASVEWNPLTDDGDALRLAVKLQMTVSIGPDRAFSEWWKDGGTTPDHEAEPINGDASTATRRAITRAAAEIARAADAGGKEG